MNWSEMNDLTRQEVIKAALANGISYAEMARAWNCDKTVPGAWYRQHKDDDFSNLQLGTPRSKSLKSQSTGKSLDDVCKDILGDKYNG